jgi:hypothetical protein
MRSKDALAKAKAKAKITAETLIQTKAELKTLKEKFRKDRHRRPSSDMAQQFKTISGTKNPKLKADEMMALLQKFRAHLESKTKETFTRSSKDFEESRDLNGKRRLDYRTLCIDNKLNMWGGPEVATEIERMVNLNYYKRKPIKGKELLKVRAENMNKAAEYVYFIADCKKLPLGRSARRVPKLPYSYLGRLSMLGWE